MLTLGGEGTTDAKGEFTVELPEGNWNGALLKLYDAVGKIVWDRSVNDRRNIVEVSGLDAGLYFLEVTLEGRRGIVRMVVQ